MNLCTLSPTVCKILPHPSKKKKVHYYVIVPPLSPSLSPKALIVLPQQKHLMLYLNVMNLNEPLHS